VSSFLRSLRLLDVVVFLLAVTITVFCTVSIYGKSGPAVQFIIQGKGENWVYPVDQTAQVVISGPLGQTVVELKDKEARVISSPCANQTCVASGAVHRRGQWIACLPNAVFVRLEAAGGKIEYAEVDAAVW
jgi:hypothetical protein